MKASLFFSRNSEKQGTVRSHLVNVMCLRGTGVLVPRRMIQYERAAHRRHRCSFVCHSCWQGFKKSRHSTLSTCACCGHAHECEPKTVYCTLFFKTHFSFFLFCVRGPQKSLDVAHTIESYDGGEDPQHSENGSEWLVEARYFVEFIVHDFKDIPRVIRAWAPLGCRQQL